MSRKFIYLIVIIATIALVIFSETKSENLSATKVETNAEALDILTIDEIYNSAEMLSPLIIKNTQNDDEEITYNYKIKISEISGAYRYTYNGKESYLVFSANGEAQVSLKSNESITIYDLPNEVSYSVEQTNNVSDKYTTTANNVSGTSIEGTISLETTALFENKTIIVPTKPNKNPYTSSKPILIFGFICLTSMAILYRIRKIKIKRFE